MLEADDESRGSVPWWPGVLGAWIFLTMGFAVVATLGGRPFDPFLTLDTHYGLSGWILDPLLRGLVSAGADHSFLRPIYFLLSGLGILGLGLALRHRLEILPLSLVLFLLGTWPWTLRDPAGLLAAPHHLRLLILGLLALAMRGTGRWALILPALLGLLRQGLVGGVDWQIDVLFLFLIFSTLHGAAWNSKGRPALYGIGIFAMTVFLTQSLGLVSGRIAPPVGLSGFEDSNVDFGSILLYRPGFLLLTAALVWFLLASGARSMGRVFSSTMLYSLSLVLFVFTFPDARASLAAQDQLMVRDRSALETALPATIPEPGLLLINLPLHLRPILLTEIAREDWGRLSTLDTWDTGTQIFLPADFGTTASMSALRYGPMGPMRATPSALSLLKRFPRASLLSHKARRFPMRLEDMVSLGKLPPYLGSMDVESYLVDVLAEGGRTVSDSSELPELDPSAVRMKLGEKGPALVLSFESDAPGSFVVAVTLGRGHLKSFEADRDPIRAVSLEGEKTVLDYLISLTRRLGENPDRDGYKLQALQGLEVKPFAWVPGYGPVFLVHKAAGGTASFEFEVVVDR